MLARKYSVMTTAVPAASEMGMSRRGFFTSAAVNPMLFQASAENSEPTCATPNSKNKPNAPLAAVTVGTKLRKQIVQCPTTSLTLKDLMYKKLSLIAAAFRP